MLLLFFFFVAILDCWASDPHNRPGFKDILLNLEDIAHSGFTSTPQESFHTMQDGWKKEIAEVLRELRLKEKVINNLLFFKPNFFYYL